MKPILKGLVSAASAAPFQASGKASASVVAANVFRAVRLCMSESPVVASERWVMLALCAQSVRVFYIRTPASSVWPVCGIEHHTAAADPRDARAQPRVLLLFVNAEEH